MHRTSSEGDKQAHCITFAPERRRKQCHPSTPEGFCHLLEQSLRVRHAIDHIGHEHRIESAQAEARWQRTRIAMHKPDARAVDAVLQGRSHPFRDLRAAIVCGSQSKDEIAD